MSRRRVKIWVNGGESTRSDVSSRSRRSEAEDKEERGGSAAREAGGEGIVAVWDLEGDLSIPDSRRTNSSCSRGGRR